MSAKEKPKRPRLSIMPARAVRDQNISAQALRVLALLGCHTDDDGWCTRSQVRMAEELGVSRGTIQNSIDELLGLYLERREETRPNVRPEPGRHPHCSYSYRVKLDPDPETDAGASQLAPTSASQLAGGANQDLHRVPASLAPLTERPLGNDPLVNSQAPDGAGESGKVASLGQGASERWPEFRSAVAKSWPGGFPAENETACKAEFERQTRLHAPDMVIACALAHGAAKTAQNAARSKTAGMVTMRKPSNWLKDGDWQGYIPHVERERAQETGTALALGAVRVALGDDVFNRLRRCGVTDAELAKFEGLIFEAPGNFIAARPFQADRLRAHTQRLSREFGEFTVVERRTA